MCSAKLWQEDAATVNEIRQAIKRYNASQGIATTPTSGYHETLTLFWVETVRGYLREASPESRLAAVCGAIKTLGLDSGLPRKRYTFDVFTSTEARARWIPPDA